MQKGTGTPTKRKPESPDQKFQNNQPQFEVGQLVEYDCSACGWSSAVIDSIDESGIIIVHDGYSFLIPWGWENQLRPERKEAPSCNDAIS